MRMMLGAKSWTEVVAGRKWSQGSVETGSKDGRLPTYSVLLKTGAGARQGARSRSRSRSRSRTSTRTRTRTSPSIAKSTRNRTSTRSSHFEAIV